MSAAERFVAALRDPASSSAFDVDTWTAVLAAARAERPIGSLAHRLSGLPLPGRVAAIFAAAREQAEQDRTAALWEAEMARRALAPLGCPVVLLKGTAYHAAGLAAGQGARGRRPRHPGASRRARRRRTRAARRGVGLGQARPV